MGSRSERAGRGWRAGLAVMAMLAAAGLAPAAEAEGPVWSPDAPLPAEWDWIQLTSGEWLKGEFVALYDEELEFESDELDLLVLDWEDILQVRTAQVMEIGLLGDEKAVGQLLIEGDRAQVIGERPLAFERAMILTITSGAPSELSRWSGKVSLGMTVRRGNVDQVDTNGRANFKRRTVENRVVIDYIANFSNTDDVETANNQRLSGNWNKFINDRFFVKPVIFEWYRDRFQNIDSRTTFAVGAGYQLYDTSRTDWEVSGGPGYQQTRFVNVEPGQQESRDTAVLVASTLFEQAWAKWFDFTFEYRGQLTNEASGRYNHHAVMSFETEITSLLDFDVTFIWDCTEKPQPGADGVVPDQDDFRMVVALGIEF